MLVRPETVELEPAANGAVREGALGGEILSHTFLGSVTRIKLTPGSGGPTRNGEVSASIAFSAIGGGGTIQDEPR